MSEEKLNFVKLACSKDVTRYNLTSVYRDVDKFVATDGHRLHITNGLPKIDKPHYIDGTDGEFPDYQRIIPREDSVPMFRVNLQVTSELVKRLDCLDKLVTTWDIDRSATFSVLTLPVAENVNPLCLTVCVSNLLNTPEAIEARVRVEVEPTESPMPHYGTVSLNTKYVMDVLKFAAKMGKWGCPVEFSAYGPGQPTLWKVPGIGTALIMPMRTPTN